MFEITSAQWSAAAASFSALSAGLSLMINRRNLLDAARPELVLEEWSRTAEGAGDAAHEVLAFAAIRNVGRGPALHTVINCSRVSANRPEAAMGTVRIPILAANGRESVQGRILLWWKNVPATERGGRHLPLAISILCWDSRGFRHETTYRLMAVELSPLIGVADAIAPGVGFGTRTTRARAVWSLQFQARLARIPLLGRVFRDRVERQ